jgi:hypothetical protein
VHTIEKKWEEEGEERKNGGRGRRRGLEEGEGGAGGSRQAVTHVTTHSKVITKES